MLPAASSVVPAGWYRVAVGAGPPSPVSPNAEPVPTTCWTSTPAFSDDRTLLMVFDMYTVPLKAETPMNCEAPTFWPKALAKLYGSVLSVPGGGGVARATGAGDAGPDEATA